MLYLNLFINQNAKAMENKITQIDKDEYILAYVDACPSELIQNSQERFICVGLVTYFGIDRKNLKSISQFKKTRGLNRKLQTQEYIIQNIKNERILPVGIINWNFKPLALKNGLFILNDAGLLKEENIDSQKITMINYEIKLGLCTSLSWYSIVISIFLKFIGPLAKLQDKNKVAIFLDLLPGDNIDGQRNFEIVEYLINNSRLSDFQADAIIENNLDLIGFGYGIKEKSTKDFKNDYEFVITDWIVQSFYSMIKYQTENLQMDSDEYQLSKLARFLLDENKFKMRRPFSLIPEQ